MAELKGPKTPCMICEKAILYLWPAHNATNLNNAVDVSIAGYYGSDFDTMRYTGIICDNCLDSLIQRNKVEYIKSIYQNEKD